MMQAMVVVLLVLLRLITGGPPQRVEAGSFGRVPSRLVFTTVEELFRISNRQ